MLTTNNYYNAFQQTLNQTNIKDEMNKVIGWERSNNRWDYASDVAGIFPGIGSNMSSAMNIKTKYTENQAIEGRAKVSQLFIDTLNKITPNQFANKEDAYAYAQFFNSVEGQVFLDAAHQQQFDGLAKKFHANWELKQAEYSNEQQAKIRAELQIQRQTLDENAKRQRVANASFQTGIERCNQQIGTLRQDDAVAHGELNARTAEIVERLKQQGVKIDDDLIQLIDNSEEMRQQVDQVSHYLMSKQQAEDTAKQHALEQQGISQALGFVYALGQEFNNPTITAIGFVGQEAVKINQALELMSTVSGFALLGPVGAIAMSSLALYSFFFHKKSANPMQAIMRQLQAIDATLRENHFEDLRMGQGIQQQLTAMAQQITYQLAQVQFLLAVPIMRELNEIEKEVNHITTISNAQFSALSLEKLTNAYDVAHKFAREVLIHTPGSDDINKQLCIAGQYLRSDSFDKLHTGQFLIEKSGATVWQKIAMLSELATTPNYLAGYLADVWQGLTGEQGLSLPNIDVFSRATASYVLLRLYADSGKQVFDARGVELKDMITCCEKTIRCLERMRTDRRLMPTLLAELAYARDAVQQTFTATLTNAETAYAKQNAGKPLFNATTTQAIDVLQIIQQQNFVVQCNYRFAPGNDKGKRKNRHHNVNPARSIKWLVDAKGVDNIFPEEIILAFLRGELNFDMLMYQSMTNGGGQRWVNNEGELYGLKITCQYKGALYEITSPKPGSGIWYNGKRHATIAAAQSHAKNASRTIVNTSAIERLLQTIHANTATEKQQQYQACINAISASLQDNQGPCAQYLILQRQIIAYASLFGADDAVLEQLTAALVDRDALLLSISSHLFTTGQRPELKLANYLEYNNCIAALYNTSGYSPVQEQLQLSMNWLRTYQQLQSQTSTEKNEEQLLCLRAQLVSEISHFFESRAYPAITPSEFLSAVGISEPEKFFQQYANGQTESTIEEVIDVPSKAVTNNLTRTSTWLATPSAFFSNVPRMTTIAMRAKQAQEKINLPTKSLTG